MNRLLIVFVLLNLSCNNYELCEDKLIYFKEEGNFIVTYCYKDKRNKNEYLMTKKDSFGNISFEAEVRNHKFYSYRKTYHTNGKLKLVDSFITECDISDCGSDVLSREFASNGILIVEHYLTNCIENGLCKHFDSVTGIIRTAYIYKDGERNGKQIEYSKEGKINYLYFVTNDTIRGNVIEFNNNGDTVQITNYINNAKAFPIIKFKKDTIIYGDYSDETSEFVKWIYSDRQRKILNVRIEKIKHGKVTIPE